MTPRAPALSPDERRAALIEATLPLVLERGMGVTTKEIAAAAGVAEGTIFRVFDSKDHLLLAAARSVFDSTDLLTRLRAVDLRRPLGQRLADVAEIVQSGARRVVAVFLAFGPPCDRERLGDLREARAHAPDREIDELVCRVLAPDADALRKPVPEVARLLRMLAWASVHPVTVRAAAAGERIPTDPMTSDPMTSDPMTAAEIADILLHGVLAAPSAATLPSSPATVGWAMSVGAETVSVNTERGAH